MPHRKASNGRINPFRVAKKRRLRDGSEKEYTVWRAKIDVGETRTGARRQRTVEAPTRREYEAKARDMLKEIRDYGVAADWHATLGKYARQWLKTKMEMVDHKSYQTYETAVYVHLADYLDTPLSKFTPTMVTGILRDAKAHDKRGRETGPAGTSARRKIKTTLGQIMKLAVADGINGIYNDRYKSIVIDYRLPYAAKRVTFAHELVHFAYADDKCQTVLHSRNEIRTRKATALALVDIVQYATLEQEYDGDLFKIADELEVTVELLTDFQKYVLRK